MKRIGDLYSRWGAGFSARSLWSVLAMGVVCFSSALSRAEDVSYTLHVNVIEPALMLDPDVKISVSVSGACKRLDLSIQAGPIHKRMTALYLYDKQQAYYLDPEHHVYTAFPIMPGQDEILDLLGKLQQRNAAMESQLDAPPPTVTMTFHVEDKGEVILQKKTAHSYLETMRIESVEGTKAPARTLTREIWLSSMPSGLSKGAPMTALPAGTPTGKPLQVVQTRGDVEQARQLNRCVPLKMKIAVTDGPVIEVETRDISQKPVEGSLFTIPSGFQELSGEAFARKMQNGRRRSGQGLLGGPSGG